MAGDSRFVDLKHAASVFDLSTARIRQLLDDDAEPLTGPPLRGRGRERFVYAWFLDDELHRRASSKPGRPRIERLRSVSDDPGHQKRLAADSDALKEENARLRSQLEDTRAVARLAGVVVDHL